MVESERTGIDVVYICRDIEGLVALAGDLLQSAVHHEWPVTMTSAASGAEVYSKDEWHALTTQVMNSLTHHHAMRKVTLPV